MLPFHHHHRHHPSTTGVNDQQTGEQVRTPRKKKWLYLPITFFLWRKGKLFAALPIKRYPEYQRNFLGRRMLPRRLTHARSKVEPKSGQAAGKNFGKERFGLHVI